MKYIGSSISDIQTLASLLGSTSAELGYLSFNMHNNVRRRDFPKKNNPDETRTIAAPSKRLKAIQRAIKETFLTNYTYEDYVYGLGGNTLKDHALVHQGRRALVQIDIRDFYPSISHRLVYDMWVKKFGFAPEIARLLTKLTTMNGGLMQGFPTSSHIATIAAEDFALAISIYCQDHSMKFTQYVDDFNMSGSNIDYKTIFKKVVLIGREYGLSIKKRKTRINHEKVGKQITGVSLNNRRTRATRAVRQSSVHTLKELARNPKDKHHQNRAVGYAGFLKHLDKKDGRHYSRLIKKIRENDVADSLSAPIQ